MIAEGQETASFEEEEDLRVLAACQARWWLHAHCSADRLPAWGMWGHIAAAEGGGTCLGSGRVAHGATPTLYPQALPSAAAMPQRCRSVPMVLCVWLCAHNPPKFRPRGKRPDALLQHF